MAMSPNPRLQRTRSALLRSPLSRKPLGTLKHTWVLVGLLAINDCASRPSAPNPFSAWGNTSIVAEPERSVIAEAAAALATPDPSVAVLSRYAGEEMQKRLDLA